MRLQYISAVAAVLFTSYVCAEPDQPYLPHLPQRREVANIGAFISDIESFATSLTANPTFTSILSALQASDPALVSSIEAFGSSAATAFSVDTAAVSILIAAMPTQYQSFVGSVVQAEMSIAVQDGILEVASTTAAGAGTTGTNGAAKAGFSATGTSSGLPMQTANAAVKGLGDGGRGVGILAGVFAGVFGLMVAL